MRKYLMLALFLAATPVIASDDDVATDPALTTETYMGKTLEDVGTSLTGLGYEVRKSELENGRMEFKAIKERRRYEVYVSPETGRFLRMKRN